MVTSTLSPIKNRCCLFLDKTSMILLLLLVHEIAQVTLRHPYKAIPLPGNLAVSPLASSILQDPQNLLKSGLLALFGGVPELFKGLVSKLDKRLITKALAG
jgi:hypothetical protein